VKFCLCQWLQVKGIDYKTADGTCVRDYIDVTDLVDAHVKALAHAKPRKVGIYNVGTGKGFFTIFFLLKFNFIFFHFECFSFSCIS